MFDLKNEEMALPNCPWLQGQYTVSKPICPFPVQINRHYGSAHEHTIDWVNRYGLVQPNSPQSLRFPRAQFAKLAALTHPDVEQEDLNLTTDWHSWLFAHDDICDDSNIGRHAEQLRAMDLPLLNQLRGVSAPNPKFPLSVALDNILRRIEARTDSRWLHRFSKHVEEYLSSNVWEARNRQNGIPPALNDYIKMRRYTGAVLSCFDLIFIVEDLSPDECGWINDRPMIELEATANNHICWINDIFGLDKEIRENNINNLVLVLQNQDSCDLQKAVDTAIDLCNAQVRNFTNLADKQISSPDRFSRREIQAMERYIKGMKSWMSGHLVWYQHTGRYLPRDN